MLIFLTSLTKLYLMKLNSFGYSTKSKETSPIGGDIISRTMANPFMVSEAHGKSSLLFK